MAIGIRRGPRSSTDEAGAAVAGQGRRVIAAADGIIAGGEFLERQQRVEPILARAG